MKVYSLLLFPAKNSPVCAVGRASTDASHARGVACGDEVALKPIALPRLLNLVYTALDKRHDAADLQPVDNCAHCTDTCGENWLTARHRLISRTTRRRGLFIVAMATCRLGPFVAQHGRSNGFSKSCDGRRLRRGWRRAGTDGKLGSSVPAPALRSLLAKITEDSLRDCSPQVRRRRRRAWRLAARGLLHSAYRNRGSETLWRNCTRRRWWTKRPRASAPRRLTDVRRWSAANVCTVCTQ